LPLTVEPKPAHIARVFGAAEIFTPATPAVERAIAANDTSIIAMYGRFLV
jgi:hypothetical protein